MHLFVYFPFDMLEKKNFSISVPHLHYIIKYYTQTIETKILSRKEIKFIKTDKKKFYKTIIDKGIKDIISIDETGFYLNMSKNFGRCSKGKRCYRTVHKYPYVKFNFICAIKYGKVIGYELYPKQNSGIDAVKFNDFYNRCIKNKYEDHLIILDNARFHKSPEVINNIINNIKNSKNKIIFSLPYNPNLNPIENLFSQLKNHVRNESPTDYNSLKNKISSTHLKTISNIYFYKRMNI